MPEPVHLHLAVALDGAGWHPAAWREPDADPAGLFGAPYWLRLVAEAERGLLDLVTIEDSFGLQSDAPDGADARTDRVRGRLDAVLLAARLAPRTAHLGLVPTGTTTHTEPFHLSTALATLDFVSSGRGGWRPQVSPRPSEARHVGLRETVRAELLEEAAEVVDAVRRLWDSWEDDAVIRDVATGRFVDRDKLHRTEFEGRWFSVKGPSIVPRPPQGQLPVVAVAHAAPAYRFAAEQADVAILTPGSAADAGHRLAELRSVEADRTTPLLPWADLEVYLDDAPGAAAARRARLDEADGAEHRSDAAIAAGTPAEVADLLQEWAAAGITGFRLRPGALPHDLVAITTGLVPELQRRGVFRTRYAEGTLRERLGLPAAVNRYAGVTA